MLLCSMIFQFIPRYTVGTKSHGAMDASFREYNKMIAHCSFTHYYGRTHVGELRYFSVRRSVSLLAYKEKIVIFDTSAKK